MVDACVHTVLECFQAHKPGGVGGATHLPNLPKGPLLATKWAKNGVFVGGLKGWGSKSLLFGSKRSTFGGSRTAPNLILAMGLSASLPQRRVKKAWQSNRDPSNVSYKSRSISLTFHWPFDQHAYMLFSLTWAFCMSLVQSGPECVSAQSNRLNKQTNKVKISKNIWPIFIDHVVFPNMCYNIRM